MKYRTIVADPPWPIGDMPAWFREDRQSARERSIGHNPRPYGVMTLDEIAALPVRDMAATRAHLYLWTINDHLEASYGVARAWGFEPSATLTWCKPPRPGGLGGTFPSNTEFILFCSRDWKDERVISITSWLADQAEVAGITRRQIDLALGTSDMGGWWLSRLPHRCACPTNDQWEQLRALLRFGAEMDATVAAVNEAKGETIAQARANGRWFQWPVAEHSRKPEAFLDLVEHVSPGPYLELFARRQRLGWDTWGNEALEHVEMGA